MSSALAGHHSIMNASLLWVIAAVLVIAGIVVLIQGSVILGIVLIIAGLLVGPCGVSMFSGRRV